MKISQKGIDLITSLEGLSLTAYRDIVGVLTIGYGHTKDVQPNEIITKEKAVELLLQDLQIFESGVANLVTVAISQNQFDALVSFTYNVGESNLRKSTLLMYVNTAKFKQASQEFLRWNKAGGKVIEGLTRRRIAESKLFGEN